MAFVSFLRDNARFLTAGALLTFASSFGQTYFISVFAGEIRGEFGLTHAGWGAIYAAGTMASAVVMIWLGLLTDRFRARALGVGVLISLAAACLLMALTPAVWLLPVAVFALRLAGQGMSSQVATVAIARWFVATRGRALSIASLGFALGEALLPLIFVALLVVAPWRSLWVLAAVIALILVPILWRLLSDERTPQSVSAENHAAGMGGLHWARGAVLRHWLFWVMVPSILGQSAFLTAFFFQQVHVAEVKGWSHLELVALFPLYTVAGVAAMLTAGWAIDRFGSGRVAPVIQIPAALGFWAFSAAPTPGSAAIGVTLLALSAGASSTLPGAFWAEYFGTRHLGGIKAMATAVMVLGSAIGPGITGYFIDQGISFPDQMPAIAVYFLVVAVIVGVGVGIARRRLPSATEVDVIRP
ncbi:MAG: MFS transporter [Pseudomonadota bacterium]